MQEELQPAGQRHLFRVPQPGSCISPRVSLAPYNGWHCLQGATQITAPSSCAAPDPAPAPGCPCSALPASTGTSAEPAAAWECWFRSWGWPWMRFNRQCRHSTGITWNDYFRADFPLKKPIVLHAHSLIFTQRIYIRTHFPLSVMKKKHAGGI